MKRYLYTVMILLAVPACAGAQQIGSNTAPKQDVALSNYLRSSYASLSKDMEAIVALMPEQDFAFKPAGAAKEVRTFGEIALHFMVTTAWVCAMGEGKPENKELQDTTLAMNKTKLLSLLKDTNVVCTNYLATLTDSQLPQLLTSGSGPNELQAVRGNSVIFAIAHGNEHYGNLVSYIRARGLVPPPTPAQASFLSRKAVAK